MPEFRVEFRDEHGETIWVEAHEIEKTRLRDAEHVTFVFDDCVGVINGYQIEITVPLRFEL